MNQTEKRRRQLLEETRRTYSERHVPPAVHPRYNILYDQIYENDSKDKGGSFGIRVIFCLFLLAAFLTFSKNEELNNEYDIKAITEMIQKDMEIVHTFTQ